MIGNETQTQRTFKTIWATIGKTQELHQPDHTGNDRTPKRMRSKRVVEAVSTESLDNWLDTSSIMVAGCISGLAKNQRRVRYFGFEAANDEIKESN